MTYGRQPQIDKDIDWVIDEDGNVLGYQRDLRSFSRIVSLSADTGLITDPAQRAAVGEVAAYKKDAAALRQPVVTAVSGSPTITTGNTSTTITSAQTIAKDDACFEYLGVGIGTWGAVPTMNISNPADGFMSVEFMINSASFDLVFNNQNSRIMVWVDDQPALSQQIQLTASGAMEYTNLTFSARATRKIRVDGFNLPFGGLRIGANDTVWAVNNSAPLMFIGPGDSYTQGTGARSQSMTWAGTFARTLGYRFWLEGLGGSGWNSASPNSPAERATVRGALIRRVAGVNTTVTPDKRVVPLGYNDAGGNMTTAAAAFDAYIAAVPTRPDLIIGPWTPLGTTGNLTLVKTMLQGRAAAYGINYLDIDNLVNSVNKGALTGGDNVHPTNDGHDFIAIRAAQLAVASGYLKRYSA